MIKKVFVLVKDTEVSCYHNLKQLAVINKLPYFTLRRRLLGVKYYKHNSFTIAITSMEYSRKKKKNRKQPQYEDN